MDTLITLTLTLIAIAALFLIVYAVRKLYHWWVGALGMVGATFIKVVQYDSSRRDIRWVGIGDHLDHSPWAGHGTTVFVKIVQQHGRASDLRDCGQGGGYYEVRGRDLVKIAPRTYLIKG